MILNGANEHWYPLGIGEYSLDENPMNFNLNPYLSAFLLVTPMLVLDHSNSIGSLQTLLAKRTLPRVYVEFGNEPKSTNSHYFYDQYFGYF